MSDASSTLIRNLVFIDAGVSDLQDLVAGLNPGEAAYVLDPGSDGLDQIAKILAAGGYGDLSSISIVGHGSAGELSLGASTIADTNLASHSGDLSAIGAALKPGGDLQLYGCDVASGASGHHFIADLSWTLDSATGAIEASSPFTAAALANFAGILPNATLTATQSTVVTTDLDADGDVGPGDTVTTTVTITNTGAIDATGLSFDETLNRLTFVAGKINVSPLAFDDSFTTAGNTQLIVNATGINPGSTPAVTVAGNLFTNDKEFLGDTFTLKSFTQGGHGTVTVNSDGTFTYLPNAGFTGADTFTYTITDKGLDGIAGNADDLTATPTIWPAREPCTSPSARRCGTSTARPAPAARASRPARSTRSPRRTSTAPAAAATSIVPATSSISKAAAAIPPRWGSRPAST